MLVVLAGLPGVGKSTLAQALAPALGADILDKDRIRDAIFPPAAVDYSDAQNALASDVVYMVAGYMLERSPDACLILDGKPFSRESQRQEARQVAERTGSAFRLIHCVAPDALVQQWLATAAAHDPQILIADRTFAKYLRIKQAFEPMTTPHLVVDTSHDMDTVVATCVGYVSGEAEQG
jgi:adenylylsulfate kinase